MGRGNRESAAVLRRKLLADAPQIAYFAHDDLYAFEDMLARLGDAFEPLAVPRKNFHAQLFFKFDDGFGNAGLRRVQDARGFGQVQVAPYGFLNKTELVKIHIKFKLFVCFIMPNIR